MPRSAPWPNPANDRVLLRYASRDGAPASLSIYNVHGRLTTHVADVPADGIIRTTPWFPDGRPGGVYFAVLSTGSQQISRKIIVAR